MFENAFYILTPQSWTPYEKIEELKSWLKGTNANFLVLDAKEHDYLTGVVSHFPHIIAASLVSLVKKNADRNPFVSMLTAGGFRDITRIASSNPRMWANIVKENADHLLALLDEWILEMRNVQSIINTGNDQLLTEFFANAKSYRDSIPIRSKGAIPSYYDLYVDIIDKPGAIAKVTTLLAEEEIQIANLNIIEAREGLMGVLRITFQNEKDRQRAQTLLENHQIKTY